MFCIPGIARLELISILHPNCGASVVRVGVNADHHPARPSRIFVKQKTSGLTVMKLKVHRSLTFLTPEEFAQNVVPDPEKYGAGHSVYIVDSEPAVMFPE